MIKNIQTATISLLADMATNSRWAKMREHKDERKVDLSCAPIDHTQFVRVYPRPQPRYARFPAGMSMFREEIDAEMTVSPQCQSTGERMSMGSNGRYKEDDGNKLKRSLCMPQMEKFVSGMIAYAGKMAHRNHEPVAPRLASPVELDDIPSEPLQTESALLETPRFPPLVARPLRRSNAVRRPMHPGPDLTRDLLPARLSKNPDILYRYGIEPPEATQSSSGYRKYANPESKKTDDVSEAVPDTLSANCRLSFLE